MTPIMISLAASATVLSLSTGAFACAQLDKSQSADTNKNASIILAQATGATGNRRASGYAKPERDRYNGSTGAVDASQSERKDTNESPQSGAK